MNINLNLLIFVSFTTMLVIIYLIQKNNYIESWRENKTLKKELLFYKTQVDSENGNVTGLKRSDRIRKIATEKLDMYIAEPESIPIPIYE
tara:strand:+ start:382 stop:651 length:270 start_codon:yes stop_codon:yes gene_type:complete